MGESRSQARSTELVLASSSPRRRDLLEQAGYCFRVCAPDLEERARPGERPEETARRLALEKGQQVAPRAGPGACVLAADTIVVLDGQVLGKPRDCDDARRMLLRLAGRTHRVLTGYVLISSDDGHSERGLASSLVHMHEIAEAEARRYAETGEPLDKAGGYAVQGEAGRFVARIEGSRNNVIGLPVEEIAPLLERFGVRPQ